MFQASGKTGFLSASALSCGKGGDSWGSLILRVEGLGGQRRLSSRCDPAPSIPWTQDVLRGCQAVPGALDPPPSVILPPPPSPHSLALFSFSSPTAFFPPVCLPHSVSPACACIGDCFCLSCCNLSPEARTRGRRPGTLLGKNMCVPHIHAPPCNSAQTGAGGRWPRPTPWMPRPCPGLPPAPLHPHWAPNPLPCAGCAAALTARWFKYRVTYARQG